MKSLKELESILLVTTLIMFAGALIILDQQPLQLSIPTLMIIGCIVNLFGLFLIDDAKESVKTTKKY